MLLQNTGVIEDGDQGWAIFLWGGGVIILLEAVLRLLVPRFRRPVLGAFIWGAIWIGVGFGLYYDRWEVIGPIVIIAIGVADHRGEARPPEIGRVSTYSLARSPAAQPATDSRGSRASAR